MPVTFQVAQHNANPVFRPTAAGTISAGAAANQVADVKPEEQFFKSACYKQWSSSKGLLQTSVVHNPDTRLISQKNGFVNTVMQAYAGHHHLRIRPDDVWIAILTQLSFYVNAHAEELRAYFVAHEGKKALTIDHNGGSIHSLDYGHIARRMSELINENLVDSTLCEWILPDFTTSTVHDQTICSIVMMSTLKAYFGFKCMITCGIPTVTLEGEKSDWERLYARLDRLPELGEQPACWATMLEPILRRFVNAFDGEPDLTFWSHVFYSQTVGCGEQVFDGWITAFCAWSSEGKWRGGHMPRPVSGAKGSVLSADRWGSTYTLDGIRYLTVDLDDIPAGYSEVDLLVDGVPCSMVAGHVGAAVSKSFLSRREPESEDAASDSLDTLSPAPQWFIYVKA